jgi:hypothetical protein
VPPVVVVVAALVVDATVDGLVAVSLPHAAATAAAPAAPMMRMISRRSSFLASLCVFVFMSFAAQQQHSRQTRDSGLGILDSRFQITNH